MADTTGLKILTVKSVSYGYGIEIVVAADGCDGDNHVGFSGVAVGLFGDFLGGNGAVAKGVGRVSGITVDGKGCALFDRDGKVPVFDLGVVTAVVADLDL